MRTLSCILLVIFFTGCASNKANRKLKRAERLITQAEQLGAKWHTDTVFQTVKFTGANTSVTLQPTIFKRSEFAYETPRFKDTVIYQDRIRIKLKDSLIQVKCPDEEKTVPKVVTKTVTTGITILTVVQWVVLALIVGGLLVKIFWK